MSKQLKTKPGWRLILKISGLLLLLVIVYLVFFAVGLARIKADIRAGAMNLRNLSQIPSGNKGGKFTEARVDAGDGVSYDLYEPREKVYSTALVVQGLTTMGERDERIINLCRALAESGVRAVAVELPYLKKYRFKNSDVEVIGRISKALREKYPGKRCILAFSFGAGLTLTAATRYDDASQFGPILLFGTYYSLPNLIEELKFSFESEPLAGVSEEHWDNFIWIKAIIAYRSPDKVGLTADEYKTIEKLLSRYCFEPGFDEKKAIYNKILKGKVKGEFLSASGIDDDLATLSPAGKLGAVKSPVFLFHDQMDDLVSPDHSRAIFKELIGSGNGINHRLIITPLISHVTWRTTAKIQDIFKIIDAFGELYR